MQEIQKIQDIFRQYYSVDNSKLYSTNILMYLYVDKLQLTLNYDITIYYSEIMSSIGVTFNVCEPLSLN